MKELNDFIIEKLVINKDIQSPEKENKEILNIVEKVFIYKTNREDLLIDYILEHFAERLSLLIKKSKISNKTLDSTETYDIFYKEFDRKIRSEQVEGFKEIYKEIPNIWEKFTSVFLKSGIRRKMVEDMFGTGEFPIVTIYAKLGKKDNDFSEVYYTISR